MSGFVVDTSIFIAAESGRRPGQRPAGAGRISVATLTELIVGVRRSPDSNVRAGREITLGEAREFISLPYDEPVAERMAELLASARNAGRRANAMDAIIAATALTHGLAVWTLDRDFAVLAELAPDLELVGLP